MSFFYSISNKNEKIKRNLISRKMEPILVELGEQGQTQDMPPHEGEEFGYVLSGTVTLQVTTAPDTDLRDEIFFAMAERRYAVLSMERSEQSLEEIFLTLTAKGRANKKNGEESDT